MRLSGGKLVYYPNARRTSRDLSDLGVTAYAMCEGHTVKQLENGTILVEDSSRPVEPALPVLRSLASRVGVDVLNGAGNPKNTRTLGSDILTVSGHASFPMSAIHLRFSAVEQRFR